MLVDKLLCLSTHLLSNFKMAAVVERMLDFELYLILDYTTTDGEAPGKAIFTFFELYL